MATLQEELGEVRTLHQGGHLPEAMARLEALLPQYPRRPPVWAIVGEVALDMKDWAQAKHAFETAIGLAPADVPFSWRLGRLRALAGQGGAGEVLSEARAVASQHPDRAGDVSELVARMLIDAPDFDLLKQEVDSGLLVEGDTMPARLAYIRALLALHRWETAQPVFDRALEAARQPRDFANLAPLLVRCFGENERPARWRSMLTRIEAIMPEGGSTALATWRLRLCAGLRDFVAVRDGLSRNEPLLPGWREVLAASAAHLGADGAADRQATKVFCIGFPNSGGAAVAEALAAMGFATAVKNNPFTSAALMPDDADFFDVLASRTIAVAYDWLHAAYPNSRFILTVGAANIADQSPPPATTLTGDQEAASTSAASPAAGRRTRFEGLGSRAALHRALMMGGEANPRWRQAQADQTMVWGFSDQKAARAAWEERVIDFFADKPGRLLRLNVFEGEGWPQLAAFVGRPAPDQPFPRPEPG